MHNDTRLDPETNGQYEFHVDGWRTFTCLAPSDGPNIMLFERQPIGDHCDGAFTVIELDRK